VEQSKYVFGQVQIPGADFGAFHRDLFERYYTLTGALLADALIWPALEHCLKCSHLFNILDSSNSIGVTERTAFILRIRQLALGIAKAYLEGVKPNEDAFAPTVAVAASTTGRDAAEGAGTRRAEAEGEGGPRHAEAKGEGG
jgi:glycyl-tRNA synthetase alpha subunit